MRPNELTVLRNTVQRRPGAGQVSRQTCCHNNASSSAQSMPRVPAHPVYRQFDRVVCGLCVDLDRPAVGFGELSLSVELVPEELIPILCDSCVHEDGVDPTEPVYPRLEGRTLGFPFRYVAPLEEEAWRRRQRLSGRAWSRGMTVNDDDIVAQRVQKKASGEADA